MAWVRKVPATTWKLLTQTIGVCLRYRVTGLAAEGAFFAILSLPPLIFGLAGSLGYIASKWFEVETINDIKQQIVDLAARALTDDSIKNVIAPTLDQVLNGGRPDVISIGFVLALWSGSRALNVFVDTITIMYGMGGKRGIIRTRALSFTLYCAALIIGVIVLPLVLAGPDAVDALLPHRLDFLNQLYWPVVTILSAGFLNTLYHLSVPIRTPWVSDLPGSFLALSIWILGSFVLRWILQSTVGGTSIYGPLAAPIAVLMWLYMTAIAVLIGAALNAVVDRLWPHTGHVTEVKQAADATDHNTTAQPEPPTPSEHSTTPAVSEHPAVHGAPAASATPAAPAAPATPAASAPSGTGADSPAVSAGASEDGEEVGAPEGEVEPVMKAEPDRHREHHHPLTPVEQERPEARAARKVERLSERPGKPDDRAAHKPASIGGAGAPSETEDRTAESKTEPRMGRTTR